ncbi:unnamed protein product [Discosporangium mesarthrocarpum]
MNSCPDLAIVWPNNVRLDNFAAGFTARSRQGIMDRCVGAVDGLFIRIHKPHVKEHPSPARFYSGHKNGFGLNLQVTSKCFPGTCVKSKVEMLPDGYYIIGDSAYPPSEGLLTPYPGGCLCLN